MDRQTLRNDDGLTFIELLVTVAILGLAFVVIVGGMTTSIMASDMHRKQATSETLLRSAVEGIETATYVDCATPATYAHGVTVPGGFSISTTAVQYAVGTTGTFTTTCATDTGTQKITVRAFSNDGKASETVVFVKRRP